MVSDNNPEKRRYDGDTGTDLFLTGYFPSISGELDMTRDKLTFEIDELKKVEDIIRNLRQMKEAELRKYIMKNHMEK